MRRLAAAILVLVLGSCSTSANVGMDGGHIRTAWFEDESFMLEIEVPPSEDASEGTGTWVVTNLTHRYEDGLFGWQIHYSSDHESIVVIPNDFLMVRSFPLNVLGIEILEHAPRERLSIRITPVDGGPRLLRVGDRLEIHALWLDMDPITAFDVPSPDRAVAAVEGLEGGGGEAIDVSQRPVSVHPLPERTTYVQGETIEHRFRLSPDDDAPMSGHAVTYSLVRDIEGERNLVKYFVVRRDDDTGLFEIQIETSDLLPAKYVLYAWISGRDVTYQSQIEVLAI